MSYSKSHNNQLLIYLTDKVIALFGFVVNSFFCLKIKKPLPSQAMVFKTIYEIKQRGVKAPVFFIGYGNNKLR